MLVVTDWGFNAITQASWYGVGYVIPTVLRLGVDVGMRQLILRAGGCACVGRRWREGGSGYSSRGREKGGRWRRGRCCVAWGEKGLWRGCGMLDGR
jgi:hypothetical protein